MPGGQKSMILDTLIAIGAVDKNNVREVGKTRDKDVKVFEDRYSGVIFLEDFYVGDEEYQTNDYEYEPGAEHKIYEETVDATRRLRQHNHLIQGKQIVDFGCGSGAFLQLAKPMARIASGVEISTPSLVKLEKMGIHGQKSLDDVLHAIDTLFLFHVLEHLPNPLQALESFLGRLESSESRIVIEVPHARDFLLGHLRVEEFASHTFWSQHLVLHTRESLTRLLAYAGFRNISIVGVQRYGLANHIGWLASGKGGGHKGPLAFMERGQLRAEYEQALVTLDATDTLVAVATA